MTWKEPPDTWQIDDLVIVVAEIEEGVAVVAVKPEMLAGQNLEAAAGVPAEFRCAHFVEERAFERFNTALVPTRATEQIRLNRARGKLEQQRHLNGSLLDLLIEKVEVLAVAVEGHFDAGARRQAQADLTADDPDGLVIDA